MQLHQYSYRANFILDWIQLWHKKRRGFVLLSVPHPEALAIAYFGWTDNVRAHADMKIITAKRPYNTLDCTPKGTIHAYRSPRDWYNHTPGHLPLTTFKTKITVNLLDLQRVLNTASINAFHYVWIVFPPKARLRIYMSWLTSLHSARRRLPTRLSWKNSSYSDNCDLAIQSDCKNTKIYWEKTRNGRKYKYRNTNLRIFKPIRLNISIILCKKAHRNRLQTF